MTAILVISIFFGGRRDLRTNDQVVYVFQMEEDEAKVLLGALPSPCIIFNIFNNRGIVCLADLLV